MLRRWNEDANLANDPLVAELHRIYYDDPVFRLVSPTTIFTQPSAGGSPAVVSVNPPDTFVGTLRVSVSVTDGTKTDTEHFSVQVGPELELGPIATQTMFSDQILDVTLPVTDANTPLASLTYLTTANDLGFLLDQSHTFANYHPQYDNSSGLGEKWLRSADGTWFYLRLDGGTGKALLRQWKGAGLSANDPLIAELHRVYYDRPLERLVNATSMVFSPPVAGDPPKATIDPPGIAFVGTLRVSITVSDGSNSESELFNVEVTPAIDLAPIAAQTMLNNQVLDVALTVTDPNTPLANLNYVTAADDYGFVLDQALALASYHPQYDNFSGLAEKWIVDSLGKWYFIHLDGAGKALLRRWMEDAAPANDPLVAELHRVYYDDPASRLVNASSALFQPPAGGVPPQVTIDPVNTFVGTLWVDVTVTDGTSADTEEFPVTVNASGGAELSANLLLEGAGLLSDNHSDVLAGSVESEEQAALISSVAAARDLARSTSSGESSARRRVSASDADTAFEDADTLLSDPLEATVSGLVDG
jgi:hypothetical protein